MTMVSLEQALNRDILLVDGSCKHYNGVEKPNLFKSHYIFFQAEDLEKEIELDKKLSAILGSQRARTIPEVTEEMKIYEGKILRAREYLDSQNTSRAFNGIVKAIFRDESHFERKRFRTRGDVLRARDQNCDLYHELALTTVRSTDMFASKSIKIDDPAYEELVEMIKVLDKAIGLKRRTRGINRDRDLRIQNPDTDERLVGAAYWISMFSDKKVGILTRDTDFFRLIGITSKLLGAEDFLPYNQMFRDALYKNPVNLYFRKAEEFCDVTSTTETKYDIKFNIYNVGNKENEMLREKISQFWIHFMDYYKENPIRFVENRNNHNGNRMGDGNRVNGENGNMGNGNGERNLDGNRRNVLRQVSA